MTHSNETDRRTFLQLAGNAAAVAIISLVSSCASEEKTKGNNPIACRDTHLREVDAPDSWQAMKKIGISGVEVNVDFDRTCSSLFHPDKKYSILTEQGVTELGNDVRKNEVEITAFCLLNRFDERPEEELAWVKDTIEASKKLGVPTIRIDFMPRRMRDREEYMKFSIEMGKRIVEPLGGTNIRLGIENHGSTTNDPEFLDALFEGVGSDALGLTMDTANFYWYGHPLDRLYTIYQKYADRAWHTHCKSINYPEEMENAERKMGWEYGKYCCPIYEGDIDFKKVVSILRSVGYAGDYCIENESLGKFPKEQREEVLRKEAEFLKRLI